jgi:endoglucanase
MFKNIATIIRSACRSRLLVATLLGFMSQVATAQCLTNGLLQGVNLAGAEFNSGKLPGKINKDYLYPNQADLDYIVALGGNVIRLPFRWERIQPTLFGELAPAELRNLNAVVAAAKERQLCVILDVHNYGNFGKDTIGSAEVPVDAFHDLWTRLAKQFTDPEATIFGLMNEPAKLPIALWATTAKSTVTALRDAGATNIILVPGGRWSGVHEWFKQINGTSNAEALSDLHDPLGKTWIEAHQYADSNYSGMGQECINPERFEKMFTPLSAWAKKNGQKLFLGEFGVPPNENCLAALNEIFKQMHASDRWRGNTYWAAGRWWGGYPFSIQMKNGVEPAQTKILREYFAN